MQRSGSFLSPWPLLFLVFVFLPHHKPFKNPILNRKQLFVEVRLGTIRRFLAVRAPDWLGSNVCRCRYLILGMMAAAVFLELGGFGHAVGHTVVEDTPTRTRKRNEI